MGTAAPSTAGEATWLQLLWHSCCVVLLLGKGMCQRYREPYSCCLLPCTCPRECLHPQKDWELPDTPQPCHKEGKGSARDKLTVAGTLPQQSCAPQDMEAARPSQHYPHSRWQGHPRCQHKALHCSQGCRFPVLCHSPARRRAEQPVPGSEPAPASDPPSDSSRACLPRCHSCAATAVPGNSPVPCGSHGCFRHELHNSLQKCQQSPSSDCPGFSLVTAACPKASLTCQSSTEQGTYWLHLDLSATG